MKIFILCLVVLFGCDLEVTQSTSVNSRVVGTFSYGRGEIDLQKIVDLENKVVCYFADTAYSGQLSCVKLEEK